MPPRGKPSTDDADTLRVFIASGNITERTNALNGIISFFTRKLQGANNHLDTKTYHGILEALFQCAVVEKKAFLTSKAAKNTPETRLRLTAEAVRLAVNYGAASLKRKVARAIVDHITQTLPTSSGRYVEPLLNDYTKALVALLSHPANVEQLGAFDGTGWVACADFFADAIEEHAEPDRESGPSGSGSSGSRSSPAPHSLSTGNTTLSGQTRTMTLSSRSRASPASVKVLEILVQGLHCLVSAPNAPIATRGSELAHAALRILQMRQLGVGTLQQTACAVVRCIVQHLQGDSVSLVEGVVRDLLPLLGHWWHPRSSAMQSEAINAVRDEILRTLYTLQLHVEALAMHSRASGILESVRDVLDSLWMEYAKRDDRTRLQLVDLSFSHVSARCFDARVFGLATHDVSAERRWGAVETIALLEAIHARYAPSSDHDGDHDDNDDQPRKRRRVKTIPMLEFLGSRDPGTKLSALQVLPFYLQATATTLSDLSDVLQQLGQDISDKSHLVSSWAMVACAACTCQPHANDASLASVWAQAWQMAARSVSLPATSRAASALLHAILEADLVPYHALADDIHSLVTSAEVSGPALLVDSALVLMLHLVHLRNAHLPSASEATALHTVRWLFSRWKPADNSFAAVYASLASAADIANLVRACIGVPVLALARPVDAPGGAISQTWTAHQHTDAMMRYLLLLPVTEDTKDTKDTRAQHALCRHATPSDADEPTRLRDPASANAARNATLELLQPLLDQFGQVAESWQRKGGGGDSIAQLSAQRMESLAVFCLVCATLAPALSTIHSTHARELETSVLALAENTFRALYAAAQARPLYDVWLTTMAPLLPPTTAADTERFVKESPTLLRVAVALSQALEDASAKASSASNPDFMELDDGFHGFHGSASQGSLAPKTPALPRQTAALAASPGSFALVVTQRLHLLRHVSRDPASTDRVPASFVDEFFALPSEDILMGSDLVRALVASDLVVVPADALKIVEAMGDIIGQGEYSCCETALTACIDVMHGFVAAWPGETLDVHTRMGDLYAYLVQQSLPKNSLSSAAQVALARLLYRLLPLHASYADDLGLPPARTTLLAILRDGDMFIKYFVGVHLRDIFRLFVLKVHDELFVDILESLPVDPAWAEGISFRLLALAELACAWPTLLRRCIYHIFETPGRLRQCSKFARRCLAKIATTLSLESPRELFRLFAPQLLYTWLEHDSIEAIPYDIFGFASLDDLVRQARSEATALMLMRGQDKAAMAVAARLGTDPVTLILDSFAKVMAYCVAHDIAMAKTKTDKKTSESLIRKVLGRDQFVEAIYYHLADIVAVLIDIIDQEDPIERYFAKEPTLRHASDTMAEIRAHNHSDVVLPPNQQPMFKAKHLVKELLYLCSRTEYDLATLWTPALVASVARQLFNTVQPALGSLHACSALRKVRVLLCLAGDQAHALYPLEMLLHAVRPYIQDAECADDALGITKYLLVRGAAHLTQFPSFFAGYALSMLASLRMFLESSQASTTQESQFRATMGKAQQFHGWFSQYLQDYDSPALSDAQRTAFRSITQSATQIRASGNAEKGTPESTLLLEIFRDGEQTHRLLNDSARNLVLGMLCSDFGVPPSAHTDIIGTDDDAQTHGAVVWKSCAAGALSKAYLVWAGRVVGRSFAASGTVHAGLLRESSVDVELSSSDTGSEQGLLRLIEALTMSADSKTAGAAESALRTVVSRAAILGDSTLQLACQRSMSESVLASSAWGPYRTPPSDFDESPPRQDPGVDVFAPAAIEGANWAQGLAVYLARCIPDDVVLRVLPPVLARAKGFAEQALSYIVHLVLFFELERRQTVKAQLSTAMRAWFAATAPAAQDNVKLLLNTIVYLRMQALPGEASIADRHTWLDLDLAAAAAAASRCGMYKVALQLAELALAEPTKTTKTTRRSPNLDTSEHTGLLLDIYENIDDPDAYYGLPQSPSLASVLARLEYERDGSKTLAFRGAQYDSHLRRHDAAAVGDGLALVQALNNIGLSGLSHSLLQTQQTADGSVGSVGSLASLDSAFTTARRLGMWNLPVPSLSQAAHRPAVTIYKAFQGVHQATDLAAARAAVHEALGSTMKEATRRSLTASSLRQQLGVLAALTELDDVLGVTDAAGLEQMLVQFEDRSRWMLGQQYEDVSQLLSFRETTLSTVSEHKLVRSSLQVTPADARLVEIKGLLLSSHIYRFHQAMQESLNVATALADLVAPSARLGLCVDAAVQMETASALWDHGEMVASIRILQAVDRSASLASQTVPVSRSALLAKIGHQVSVARLESADAIQKKYLEPALEALQGCSTGTDAGRVFHQFALFCDGQLQNPDSLEDLARLQSLHENKSREVRELEQLVGAAGSSQLRSRYTSHLNKARLWLGLDGQELQRVEQTRREFVQRSLENYLLALAASDAHNGDALRFAALWLERADEASTNEAVQAHLAKVPTRKFATLVNQLTSRLLLQTPANPFQTLLLDLVYRICSDHPYHGMYQIWSGVRTRPNPTDDAAKLRQKATEAVAKRLLRPESGVAGVWQAIDRTSKCYHMLAVEKDAGFRAGQRIPINKSVAGQGLLQSLARYPIPPPTMEVPLAADCVYADVPTIARVEPSMSIAGGVSAPKILTVVGSDGVRYRQLVKGGNDDLRQDAIMEQVFAAVSGLLKLHRASRQRSLGIRTYKVLPLTASSGLIEFVPDTVPLHEYLMPAHERYHPRDLKGAQCRKEIAGVQTRPVETRLATYRKVTDRFQPVMRYFFLEHFPAPDAWFARRLAYTRTTAAVSMLGHVLGLGDRHGHNILLDHTTGEVVHIDLGVAFEMGRVLPVPELVPFRLTRDIVDGMGITGTEGVFRRCCEHTLDAMREATYSIMTILDVLRYDPLYSWSISPVRLAKLQDARGSSDDVDTKAKAVVNEPSEAERALEVVRKKLSKTLSVAATVNDLINQATDERNLAVLYSAG